jgi:hypothetical protein
MRPILIPVKPEDLDNLSNEQAAHLVLHLDEFICLSPSFVLCSM